MKIPDYITVNTGEDSGVRKTIDKFFQDVVSEIKTKVNIPGGPPTFRLDTKNLSPISPIPEQSDEYVHRLFYKEKVVAIVSETRTERNYMHFDYFLTLSKPL